MNRLVGHLEISLALSAVSVHAASAATCCVTSAEMCPATSCLMPNVGGNCPVAAYSADCGAPNYCTFDPDVGCQVTNPCTAAKWRAVGEVVHHTLKCDALADRQALLMHAGSTARPSRAGASTPRCYRSSGDRSTLKGAPFG